MSATEQTEQTYNGWTNYPTWLVYTWLTNEQDLYNAMRALTAAQDSDTAAGDALRGWLEDNSPLASGPASWYADLLQWAIERVNYREVAHAFRDRGEE